MQNERIIYANDQRACIIPQNVYYNIGIGLEMMRTRSLRHFPSACRIPGVVSRIVFYTVVPIPVSILEAVYMVLCLHAYHVKWSKTKVENQKKNKIKIMKIK